MTGTGARAGACSAYGSDMALTQALVLALSLALSDGKKLCY